MRVYGDRDATRLEAPKWIMRTHAHRQVGSVHAILCTPFGCTLLSGSAVVELKAACDAAETVAIF